MKVLVRNQAQVSECALFQANDQPGEEIITRPEVRKLIGDRRLRNLEYFQSEDTIFVDLDLVG